MILYTCGPLLSTQPLHLRLSRSKLSQLVISTDNSISTSSCPTNTQQAAHFIQTKKSSGNAKSTYHFTVYFMEVNLAHFVNNIFVFKRDEGESCKDDTNALVPQHDTDNDNVLTDNDNVLTVK